MIAFIDCYINDPVYNCINQFTENTLIPSTYHIASKFGTKSLELIKDPSCYIILGSAAHVYENRPWQKDLLDFIIPKLEKGIPVLGICYGHQLIAHHYGCEIGHINKEKENLKTIRKITLTRTIGNLTPRELHLAYSHSQVIKKLSKDFEVLAHSDFSPFEIIKHKTLPFIGIQAHPESSSSFIIDELQRNKDSALILKDGLDFLLAFYKDCLS